jgi:hypothetical protein
MKLLLWLTAAHVAQVSTSDYHLHKQLESLTPTQIGRGKTWDHEEEAGS